MLFPVVIFLNVLLVTEVVLFSIAAFKTLDISQGSVAIHLRCGGIFSDGIITHFLLILTVKNNCENRLIFDEVMAYQKNCAIFGHPVRCGFNFIYVLFFVAL